MDIINEYVTYWDKWHKRWYSSALKEQFKNNSVYNWPIPIEKKDNYFNPNPIWRYFPEPFWGKPSNNNLTAVFLNINPGGGGDCQDILSKDISKSILFATYKKNRKTYSSTVEHLSKNLCYLTSNWFERKRVVWLKKLLNCNNTGIEIKCTLENILCADLIPWHTPNVNSIIKQYITNNSKLIFDRVINPITSISHLATFKGLVFAKGKDTKEMFITLNVKQVKQYKNGKFEINLFEHNKATILIFVGGQGMSLPNPCEKKYQSENNNTLMSVSEIINKLKDGNT